MSLGTFCLLFSFVDYVPVKGEIIGYSSLTAWLISLSIMLSISLPVPKQRNLREIQGSTWSSHTVKVTDLDFKSGLPLPNVHVPATHHVILLTLDVSVLASSKAVDRGCFYTGLLALTILIG